MKTILLAITLLSCAACVPAGRYVGPMPQLQYHPVEFHPVHHERKQWPISQPMQPIAPQRVIIYHRY